MKFYRIRKRRVYLIELVIQTQIIIVLVFLVSEFAIIIYLGFNSAGMDFDASEMFRSVFSRFNKSGMDDFFNFEGFSTTHQEPLEVILIDVYDMYICI